MKNVLFTRRQIAALIGVTYVQLLRWSRHPDWFKLPANGRRPLHRRDVLAAFKRAQRGDCAVAAIPDTMLCEKELIAHYEIKRDRLLAWKAQGMPYYMFSDRTFRYVLKEVDVWYLNTHGSRRSSPPTSAK